MYQVADLTRVTPHTLRYTLGSTATSSGEALALTGAILGHANLRSAAIYAHVQHDPSLEAAKRIEKLLAASWPSVCPKRFRACSIVAQVIASNP
jgi:site-specific recombinase XerD